MNTLLKAGWGMGFYLKLDSRSIEPETSFLSFFSPGSYRLCFSRRYTKSESMYEVEEAS